MPDIRLKPKIRTVISMPHSFELRRGNTVPSPQKEKADGGAIVWRTLEYPYAEKGRDWFWAVGIVAVALAVASLILGNALFGALIIISACAIFLHAVRKPAYIRCEVGKRGFMVENTLYGWKDMEAFWIDDEAGDIVPLLHLKTKKPFSPYLSLPLRREDAAKLRGFLGRHISEERFNEPLSHQLAEIFGL